MKVCSSCLYTRNAVPHIHQKTTPENPPIGPSRAIRPTPLIVPPAIPLISLCRCPTPNPSKCSRFQVLSSIKLSGTCTKSTCMFHFALRLNSPLFSRIQMLLCSKKMKRLVESVRMQAWYNDIAVHPLKTYLSIHFGTEMEKSTFKWIVTTEELDISDEHLQCREPIGPLVIGDRRFENK